MKNTVDYFFFFFINMNAFKYVKEVCAVLLQPLVKNKYCKFIVCICSPCIWTTLL